MRIAVQQHGVVLGLLLISFLCLSTNDSLGVDAASRLDAVISAPSPGPADVAKTEEHGLSAKAVELARPFNFPITNSMVVSWIVALGLITFAQFATRNMQPVPTGAQNFMEWLVGGL